MPDPFTWWARRLPLPRPVTEKIPHGTRTHNPAVSQTCETTMPWLVYTYGRIHDQWWPLWRSSRVLGRASIGCQCAICGGTTVVVAKLPRFGPVSDRGHHPDRLAFMAEHRHQDRPHPMSWARPLLNMDAHPGGLDLDLFEMRLRADAEDDRG